MAVLTESSDQTTWKPLEVVEDTILTSFKWINLVNSDDAFKNTFSIQYYDKWAILNLHRFREFFLSRG